MRMEKVNGKASQKQPKRIIFSPVNDRCREIKMSKREKKSE